jgi:hypothetical protein
MTSAGQRDTTGRDLPKQLVKLPVDDLSQIAVLSWHWDGENHVQGSRNVMCAVRQAKKTGVRYLFIDVISIDQRLSQDDLLKQVAAFSMLYTTIPVIAAYDTTDDCPLRNTIHRPWILSEVRLFRRNPTQITYVAHNTQRGQDFKRSVENIWSSGFTLTVLGVLCNQVGIYLVSDFKFIIPSLAGVLTIAYDKLSRNDYLLTVAILCQAQRLDSEWCIGHDEIEGIPLDISREKFDRYTWSDSDTRNHIVSSMDKDIFLDRKKIAVFQHRYNYHYNLESIELRPEPKAERLIFDALGLAESDYNEYAAKGETRRADFYIKTEFPPPKMEVVRY